jgi:hypothetical protein
MADIILNKAGTEAPDKLEQYRQEMLNSDEGKQALGAKPALAGAVLSSIDPTKLKDFDFDAAFGPSKNDVLAEALVAISKKPLPADVNVNRNDQLDPALFILLAKKVGPDAWNDQTATIGARKGLGPRVCLTLWRNGGYDQICELIKHGVDTSLAARVQEGEGKGGGIYSGFVQPVQHIVSKRLRDVSLLEKNDPSLRGFRKKEAEGAKKILAALEAKNTAVTITKWSDVENSEMIKEFEKKPGTIWGFEDIRMPYVQAAHATKEGVQPLRMMELWEAVTESLSAEKYSELLDNPEKAADEFVKIGVEKIEKGLKSTDPTTKAKYDEIRRDSKKFIEEFKRDAKAFLLEFAAQMPKGTFTRPDLDDKGDERKDSSVSEVAGIVPGKFMGGLACKAGLWWAKNEKKPVYYCLDGINMDDVTNYKKVKKEAIEDFISGGGKEGGATGHDEVITLVELREILKSWDELQGTVKFVLKGKILTGDELKNKVETWQKNMQEANKKAGRTPAPDFKNFTNELNSIDGALLTKLGAEKDAKKANMDARDIVKKYGFLVKIANTRPHIVLKYIMSKCGVLIEYQLISRDLPDAARNLVNADEKEIDAASNRLRIEIKKCHKDFQTPLEAALVRHPKTGKKL